MSCEVDFSVGFGAVQVTLYSEWINGPSDRSYLVDLSWRENGGETGEIKDCRVLPIRDKIHELASWEPKHYRVHAVLRCMVPELPHGWTATVAATHCRLDETEEIDEHTYEQQAHFRHVDDGVHLTLRLRWSTQLSNEATS